MASVLAAPHKNAEYDCEASGSPGQLEAGKSERGGKSFWPLVAAFIGAVLVGFFLVGPVVKKVNHGGATMSKFAGATAPRTRASVMMSAEPKETRRSALLAGLGYTQAASVALAGAPLAASASSGDSPKFSFFGFFGNGDTLSEGAMYGSDQKSATYSPYSVYGKLGAEDQVYKKYNAKEIEFKKKMLVTSEGRVKKVIDFIEKKQWENVRTDLDSQVYNMRNTMNYLATAPGAPPGAKAAAKQFYQDMEDVNLLSKRKKQAAAADAYAAMMASLAAYNKLIGI